jgi:hypothetical protein
MANALLPGGVSLKSLSMKKRLSEIVAHPEPALHWKGPVNVADLPLGKIKDNGILSSGRRFTAMWDRPPGLLELAGRQQG